MLFVSLSTRFRWKLAGIASCVYCIHAFYCEFLYRDKTGLAFLLVDGVELDLPVPDRMYNQHTSRNSCQFPAEPCRKTRMSANEMGPKAKTLLNAQPWLWRGGPLLLPPAIYEKRVSCMRITFTRSLCPIDLRMYK